MFVRIALTCGFDESDEVVPVLVRHRLLWSVVLNDGIDIDEIDTSEGVHGDESGVVSLEEIGEDATALVVFSISCDSESSQTKSLVEFVS